MLFRGFNLQYRLALVFVVLYLTMADVYAAFGDLVPLSWSGQLAYNYGYVDSGGSESETASLLLGMNASGYVWRPWFATTSLALNVGLSSTETTSSSSESTVGSGSFSLGVFPRSRFPFSLSYSRTDSRSQSFQDISRLSADTSYRVTRLSLRQSYRPRAYNQLYNAWYYLTEFEGESFASDSALYGLDYSLRFSRQVLTMSSTHSETTVSSGSNKTTSDVFSLNHVYTSGVGLGVNSLVSYVEIDPGGASAVSQDTQAFSSFYWRPEHRPVSIFGGVRLSENKSEGGVSSAVTRSLNTNLGLGYRLTRSLSLTAAASVGTADSGDTQTLSTTQTANVSYNGGHQQLAGFAYSWQWGSGVSSSTTRTETAGVTASTDRQTVTASVGHNISRSWSSGRNSSINASFSQSASGSKSSELDVVAKTVNHGTSLSWSKRGKRGATYVNTRLSDSRSYGDKDTVYNDFGASLVSDYTINRLSSMSGNMNFNASQNVSEDEVGVETTSGSRALSGGVSYRNARPFGVYNLQFTSSLFGSKKIDSPLPSSSLRWESMFRYSLGLLSTSLNFRATESAGGNVTKSMNFQATRSF